MILKTPDESWETTGPALNPSGKFSRVYPGINRLTSEAVILKKIYPPYLPGSAQEFAFRSEGMLKKPWKFSISPLKLLKTKNDLWIVFPRFPGKSLRDSGPELARLKPENKRELLKKLLLGLAEIHAEKILHLDIKPSNILIDWQYELPEKICFIDFGMHRNLKFKYPKGKTGKGNFSFYYAAPEQILNATEVFSPATDVYALGMTFFWVLTGKEPFSEQHPAALTQLMLNESLNTRDISDFPTEILDGMTRKFKFSKPPHLLPENEMLHGLRQGMAERFPVPTVLEKITTRTE
jgi:serine/threonine protein kinase